MSLKADPSGMLNALALVYEALEKNTNAVKKQKTEAEKAAEAGKKMASEAEKSWKALMTNEEKAVEKLKQYKQYLDANIWTQEKYNEALRRTAASQKDSSQSLIEQARNLGAVALAQQTIVGMLNAEFDLRNKIKGIVSSASVGYGQLTQLSNGPQLMQQAQQIRARGGADNLDQAANLAFTIESAGLGKNLDTITRMSSIKMFKDIGQLTGAVSQMSEAFGPGAGDFNAIVSKGLVGGEPLDMTAETFMNYVAQSAGNGGEFGLGWSDEQVSAFVATLGNKFKTRTPEVARGTLRALTRLGYAGKSPDEIRADLIKRKMNPQQMMQYLGESTAQEGVAAWLGDYGRFQGILPKFEAGNSGALLQERLAAGEAVGPVAAAREARAQEGRAEVAYSKDIYRALLSAQDSAEQFQAEKQFGPFFGPKLHTLSNIGRIGSPEYQTKRYVEAGRMGADIDPGIAGQMVEELKRNNAISEAMYRDFSEYFRSKKSEQQAAPQSQPKTEQ